MSRTIAYPINNTYFDKWSSNMAYVLGFTVTDGCLHHRPGNRQAILAYSIKDLSILEFIRDELSPTRPITSVKYKASPKYSLKDRTGYNLRIPIAKSTVETLDKLGIFARKTGKEICPDNIPKEYFGDYLRGVLDGDGSVSVSRNKEPRFSIVAKNRGFLDSLNVYINNIGHIYKYPKREIYRLVVYKKQHLKILHSLIYDNNTFSLLRKKTIFDKVIK